MIKIFKFFVSDDLTFTKEIFIGVAPAIPIKHYKPKIRVSLSGERIYICIFQGGWCGNHRTDVMSAPCVLSVIIY